MWALALIYRAQHGPWRERCAHSAQCTVALHCPREQRQRSAFSQDTAVVFIPLPPTRLSSALAHKSYLCRSHHN